MQAFVVNAEVEEEADVLVDVSIQPPQGTNGDWSRQDKNDDK